MPEEQELVRRSQGGDLPAFNRLVEAYQDQVFAVAMRMVRERAAASDLTQDTFISAFRNIRAYRGGSFRGWLFRIVTNATYDHLRRQKRRPAESIEANIVTYETRLVSRRESPEAAAEREELGTEINAGLETLPEDQRIAVVLVDVEGFSYEEAAESMSCSLGTVKSRVARGRAKLRDYLLARSELLPSRFRLQSEGKARAATPGADSP
ncbi:MAG: sigma-70 family RNA polymerase sigma factor [Chloroflexi bacterium]|nr:sigma-70 family RNA polymerase sigma factor [Chloroflexota bacterium]